MSHHRPKNRARAIESLCALAGFTDSCLVRAAQGRQRSFEYLCLQHAQEISRLVGFSAVDFTMGPYFTPARRGVPGVQVDIVFDRADHVITVCEMKYSANTVGVEVIASMQRKIELLRPVAKGKTIQPVLIVRDHASRELVDQGYFYRIIGASEFLQRPG